MSGKADTEAWARWKEATGQMNRVVLINTHDAFLAGAAYARGQEAAKLAAPPPKVKKRRPLKPHDYVLLPFAGPKYDLLYRVVKNAGVLGWKLKKVGRRDVTFAHVTRYDRIAPSRASKIIVGANKS